MNGPTNNLMSDFEEVAPYVPEGHVDPVEDGVQDGEEEEASDSDFSDGQPSLVDQTLIAEIRALKIDNACTRTEISQLENGCRKLRQYNAQVDDVLAYFDLDLESSPSTLDVKEDEEEEEAELTSDEQEVLRDRLRRLKAFNAYMEGSMTPEEREALDRLYPEAFDGQQNDM
jgi:hypothetical protein